MGIGDKLLAKTAGVTVKAQSDLKTSPSTGPKTSPGRMLVAQSAVASAERRVAELEAAQGHAVELPLEDIILIPGRRRKLSTEQYEELKANLQQHPMIYPVTVVRRPDGKTELAAGYNRFHIYRELGRKTIPAVFREFATEDEVELAAFYSNLLAPSLPDFEKFLGFLDRQKRSGLSQREIAIEAGISEGQISKLFAYGRLPEAAVEVLKTAAIPDCLGAVAAQEIASILADRPEAAAVALDLIRRLASDRSFTQKQALAQLNNAVKPTPPRPAEPRIIRRGKRHFCAISARSGVLAIRFKEPEMANAWEERLAAWIESELEKAES
ncbi:ParB N-terminal domain-containing protein [Cupriavidus respiraculi]|uniref:Nucleoid occlusion protein n=1 Tax=Cupriavidus respiraculi TaxID=195930 RepID=A0ABM8XU52_9BURK|nr:ParB N-terminal domain-containing protein [Cupriavidus respiraculi]MBY4949515.1 ParB N-terminal domain-containing protein [Cupriavidus respiraculi]CAG9183898.1 Nucleoid occlusion protein [Cupriavidus respiraculi]